MKRALFIFRRDLRLEDNKGLIAALKDADEVILSFIFTPEQIENNAFKGERCLQFMIESLEDLSREIDKRNGKLYLFYGKPEEIVLKCITQLKVEGVYVNEDYTPYSQTRDHKIKQVCKSHSVAFHAACDLLLNPIENTLKSDGKPYTIFTPYFHNASKSVIGEIEKAPHGIYYSKPILFSSDETLFKKILPKKFSQAPGGRTACLDLLRNLKQFSSYSSERDFPIRDKSTHLSAHLKFTTCSIREIYYAIAHALGAHSDLIRSLYWRDFFTSIAFHFPHVFKGAFKEKFNKLSWKNDPHAFELWTKGMTGFPIVDAGMRELNSTGFMHNRVRMITASFLVKDLHIDWQWGEKYFAQQLIDYDPAVNNGNWQWSASTGCDAQPYFRLFNPWLQAKKFDADCLYIKKWVPELQYFSPKEIHSWYLPKSYNNSVDYPPPMIDHSKEAGLTLQSYKKIADS